MPITKYLEGACQSCGGHIEFPAEAVGTSINCPHCGKTTELLLAPPPDEPTIPRSTIVWTVVTILVLLLGLAGALTALKRAQRKAAVQQRTAEASAAVAEMSPPESEAPAQSEPVTKAGFRASEVTLQKNPGSTLVYAVGTLTNAAARQRFGVKVFLDLFDESGNKVGEATDYQQVIEPRAQWNFRALVLPSKTASAKIAEIREER